MKLRWSAFLLMLIVCNSLIGLLFAHGLGEQTLIKTPQGFKTIETIAQRVSKNKRIISYSVNQQKNVTGSVKKSGRSDTNCHVRITLYNTTPAQPDEILCTPAQEFYVPAINSWVPAYNLRVGDKLKSNLHGAVTIAQHDFIQKPLSVYMLEVEKYHNFFISKQEVLTHNTALPWEVAIWVCVPFGEAAMGAQAGSIFGPIGVMGGAIIGTVIGYGLRYVNDYDKVHLYDSFFNVDSIQALMKKSLNLSESSTNPRPSASTPSPDGSNTEGPSSADKPETTCPIEKIIKGLTKEPRTNEKNKNNEKLADIYEKPGADRSKEWNELPLKDKRTITNPDGIIVHLGTLPDGRVANTRETSGDGRPTIEIFNTTPKKSIKIRYDY